jgi:uncharacterized protein (TIGR03083 family)
MEILVEMLESLTPSQWNAPSLCAGWRVRDVVSHMLMPYELTTTRFLGGLVAHRFDFDRMANAWALRDHRSAPELIAALRAHGRFRVPGAGPEGELTHMVIHGLDIAYPLSLHYAIPAESLNMTLDQLLLPKARGLVGTGRLDGLSFAATDTGWRHGDGPAVEGPAPALILAIANRTAALSDLTGAGVESLRTPVATTSGK